MSTAVGRRADQTIGDPGCRLVVTPSMDCYESEREIQVFFDLAGVAEDDLRVTLDGSILRIEAKVSLDLSRDSIPLQAEFVVADYFRDLVLSRAIDREKIEVTFRCGVLEMRLPKLMRAERRKIAVSGV